MAEVGPIIEHLIANTRLPRECLDYGVFGLYSGSLPSDLQIPDYAEPSPAETSDTEE